MADSTVYVAKSTFACDLDGVPVIVHRGVTRVRGGHPLHDRYSDSFEPVDSGLQYDIEKATAVPGEKRGDELSARLKEATKAPQANEVSKEAQEEAAKQEARKAEEKKSPPRKSSRSAA